MIAPDCVFWTGTIDKRGVPQMRVMVNGVYRHKGGRTVSARKRIYEQHYGSAPGPLSTRCGRSNCVEPTHLAPIRDLTTHCPKEHEYTPENTRWRVRADKAELSPTRECATCWIASKHLPKRVPMTGPEVLAEVAWLLDGGVHPLLIADTMHRTIGSIEKLGRRYGNRAVASAFRLSVGSAAA